MKTLETERLILRKPTMEDAEMVFKNWASDPKVCQYVSWNAHQTVETTKKVIGFCLKAIDEGNYDWYVELKGTHEIIGEISTVRVYHAYSLVEVGYCYGSKFWGHGYAPEALKAVIDYLLYEENIRMVEAKHHAMNPNSGRVMQKAGMHYDGVLKGRRIDKVTGKVDDLVFYSKTK